MATVATMGSGAPAPAETIIDTSNTAISAQTSSRLGGFHSHPRRFSFFFFLNIVLYFSILIRPCRSFRISGRVPSWNGVSAASSWVRSVLAVTPCGLRPSGWLCGTNAYNLCFRVCLTGRRRGRGSTERQGGGGGGRELECSILWQADIGDLISSAKGVKNLLYIPSARSSEI